MGNFFLLFTCLFAGIVLRQSGRAANDAHKSLNLIVVNISLPAMALNYLHQLHWSSGVISAIVMPWALFAVAAVAFYYFGKAVGWPKEIVGALILVCGLGNTSFVGIPVVEAMYGKDAIPFAVVVDQAGSYLVMSTLGLIVAAFCGVGGTSWREIGKRVVTYPPFLAMILAVLLIPVEFPKFLSFTLLRLSDTVAPLALLSVGMQLSLKGFGESLKPLVTGLVFKLMICPLLVFGTFVLLGTKMGLPEHVVLVESAMGPSIGAGIVAAQHELSPKLVVLLLGVGIPLSIVSASLIGHLLKMAGM